MSRFLVDFPSGPLDQYRKKASFDWKKLKVFVESEEILEFKHELFEELKKHPSLFSKNWKTPTLDEQRHISATQVFVLKKLESVLKDFKSHNLKMLAFRMIALQLNPSLYLKYMLHNSLFYRSLEGMSSERHAHFVKQSLNGELVGCFCLTEIGHGSNTKKMQTTATYDRETKEFVLHSPNFEAAKCWSGNLAQTATHAVVFAQLITPDGVNHSLHPFIVNIRDPTTLLPYPGITVGDMGEKIGLNGVDNGFIMFQQYRIPRENLLNKTGDVSEDGTYITTIKDPSRRHGATLSVLSVSRAVIAHTSATNAITALTIAVRYAAVRRQFQPEGGEEVPIIEYQSHQCRLFPHLAAAYVLKIVTSYLVDVSIKLGEDFANNYTDELAILGLELHAIGAAVKPLASWSGREAVQECREACAAHGYLKAARIGDLRNQEDASSTVEGENHVLIQQTSNWLLKLWPLVLKDRQISFPLKSVDFLNNAGRILSSKLRVHSVEEFTEIENVVSMFQWLVCYLLKVSYGKQQRLIQQGLGLFWAKNESQVYFCKSLALAYVQHFVIQRMCITISQSDDPHIKDILTKLLLLFALVSLEKHMAAFYIGRYASGPTFAALIQESIVKLCRILKDDAVALVDSLAFPDFLLKSVLGYSDGQVYKHLEEAILHAPGALERPKWWKDVLPQKNSSSKL